MGFIDKVLDHTENLDRDEERRLLIKARAGNLAARHKLALSLARWCLNRARRYFGKGMTTDDFFQIAMAGALDAIDTHNIGANRLITHASWLIRRELNNALRRGDIIRVAAKQQGPHVGRLHPFFDRAEKEPEDCIAPEDLAGFDTLRPREKLVVRRIFWEGVKQFKLAQELGVSRQRVQQILRSALSQLRKFPHEYHCFSRAPRR